MLLQFNTASRSVWVLPNTLGVLLWTILFASASWCSAVTDGPLLRAPIVDWSHVQRAHQVAEAWVAVAKVDDELAMKSIEVSRLVGVRVTLRWSGRTMGRGDYYTPDPHHREPADLMEAVRFAVDRALCRVKLELRLQAARAGRERRVVGKDARMTLASVAGHLQLDLQVGCRLEPIGLPQTTSSMEVMRWFAPGYHGLRAHRTGEGGNIREAWIWPATALAINLRPGGHLRRLLADLNYRQADVQDMDRIQGLALSRFQVVHYVRPASDLPATRLVRGNELLPVRPLTGRDIESAARRMAEHLVRRQRDDGSFAGTFLPSSHRFEPDTAPPAEAALAAYVLARRTAVFVAHGVGSPVGMDPSHLSVLRQCQANAVEWLAPHLTDLAQPVDAAACALVIKTLVEADHLVDRKAIRDSLAKRLVRLQSDRGAFHGGEQASARRLKPATQALITAALAGLYEQTRDPQLMLVIHRARRWLWMTTEMSRLVYTLPWSGMVELRMERLAADNATHRTLFKESRPKLISLASAIRAKQVDAAPTLGPQDVVGGYDVSGATRAQPPQPTWRSAHLLAFLAAAMQHQALGRNQIDDLLACGLGARFLAQLMIDEPACFYAIHHDTMLGGVRSVLWDNRLPLDRTAMALLALTELQETLRQVASRT